MFFDDRDALDTLLEYAFGFVHNLLEDSHVKAEILAVSEALEKAGAVTNSPLLETLGVD